MGLQPFYNTSEKMKSSFLNSKGIQKIIYPLIQNIKSGHSRYSSCLFIKEILFIESHRFTVNIHFPKNADVLNKARQRLKFEELFYIQLNILQQTKWRDQHYKGFVFGQIGHYFNTFFQRPYPFELTNAQKRVLREIRIDVGSADK